MAVLRVAFEPDSSPATTGDGNFVLNDTFGLDCNDWTLDPPPHDRSYFLDHLTAQDNYWQRVSNGAVQVDFDHSDIYPQNDNEVYRLPHEMLYYHPYLETIDETEKLFELSRDVIALADPDVNFAEYTTVIIAHAGMGGDFAFALDPTPGNIPSAYLSQTDFSTYGSLLTDEGDLTDLIIIPESQNFLQYKETRGLFEDAEDPCFYQVGLNGTLALMFGFHLGLQPLYNTETGVSLVGGFALMDQGSNNFHGIVPAYPNPYTRIKKGWISPVEKQIGDDVLIQVDDAPVKISISETEYYLIENRQRNLIMPDSLLEWIDSAGDDTISVLLSDGGVVVQVDEQHAGLPGNGLNIWHIDETAQYTDENPNGGPQQLVDFVEADGAQDMGYQTQLIFADYLETGWWFDPWFAGNKGWFDLNRYTDIVGDSLLSFTSTTFPSTISNSGKPSHLRIENISKNGATMSFTIASDRIVAKDSLSTFLGWGGTTNSLWAFNTDSSQVVIATLESGEITIVQAPDLTVGDLFPANGDGSFEFRYPWVFPNMDSGSRFINVETGESHNNFSVGDPFELVVTESPLISLSYFAQNSGKYYLVKWDNQLSQIINEGPLPGQPVARFQTRAGIQPIYSTFTNDPIPAGVTPFRSTSDSNPSIPEELDIISWSHNDEALKIIHLPSDEFDLLPVGKPRFIIPLDVDQDGHYEIGLFYANSIRIINQAGIVYPGNPFTVEPYFGNPVVATLVDGKAAIFLRHASSYTIIDFQGHVLETGVLPSPVDDVENALRTSPGLSLLLSGQQLLSFGYDESIEGVEYWSEPQGNASGNRTLITKVGAQTDLPSLKSGAVFNYPNPVKGNSTTIRAWIGNESTWSIEIFSLNGSQILYTEETVSQPQSYNEWLWDASAVSNGVYLGKITAGNSTEIIKIAVIR